jgi:hypothetical protein
MAEVTATAPLMGAVNKIKESALHVFAQVRVFTPYARAQNATTRVLFRQ